MRLLLDMYVLCIPYLLLVSFPLANLLVFITGYRVYSGDTREIYA
jgi:hypothetical protein